MRLVEAVERVMLEWTYPRGFVLCGLARVKLATRCGLGTLIYDERCALALVRATRKKHSCRQQLNRGYRG